MGQGGAGTDYWDAGADTPPVSPGAPEPSPEPPPTAVAAGPTPPSPAHAPTRRPPLGLPAGAWVPVAVAVAAAAVAIVAAVALHGRASPATATTVPARHPAATSVPPSAAALTAARTLDNLLVQNDANRALVQSATDQIASCQDVPGAVAALRQRAAFRQALLGELALVDVGGLPGGAELVSTLRQAWQYSIASDRSYAAWGQDETAGCRPDDTGDPNYQAARQTDAAASAAKASFVASWNRVAGLYGLQVWQADHL